jgi:hypothetical protein
MAGFVTVASKLPHALVLELEDKTKEREPVMGGGHREVERWRKNGQAVTINGSARPFGAPYSPTVQEGVGLTFGVDADFFKAWLAQKKDYPPVVLGMIFAAATTEEAIDYARDISGVKTGFEPVDPDEVPEEFKGDITKAAA